MKHTKGPWRYGEQCDAIGGGRISYYVAEEEGNKAIADLLYYKSRTQKELEANARLIAAAPEMLEALKGFINTFCDNDETTKREYDAFEAACNAIAKAEGGAE